MNRPFTVFLFFTVFFFHSTLKSKLFLDNIFLTTVIKVHINEHMASDAPEKPETWRAWISYKRLVYEGELDALEAQSSARKLKRLEAIHATWKLKEAFARKRYFESIEAALFILRQSDSDAADTWLIHEQFAPEESSWKEPTSKEFQAFKKHADQAELNLILDITHLNEWLENSRNLAERICEAEYITAESIYKKSRRD